MKKYIIFYLMFIRLSSVLFSQSTLKFSGNIDNNTTWDYDTLLIIGDVTVNTGAALTITEGSIIQFNGYYKLNSYGRIIANGKKDNKIVFTVKDTTGFSDYENTGAWAGVKLHYSWDGGSGGSYNENDSTLFHYCIFEYSKAGGLSVENFSRVVISNCIFRNNYSSDGAGVHLDYSNAIIDSCTFINNYSYNSGGAIEFSSCDPIIKNSMFVKNQGSQGGAINFCCTNATLTNNIFTHNTSYNGGAINFHAFHGIIANCLLINNQAQYGGGAIYGFGGDPLIVNNTICYNKSNYAPGILVEDDYIIKNCILWGNEAKEYYNYQLYIFDVNPIIENCNIQGCLTYDINQYSGLTNCIDELPMFKDTYTDLLYDRETIISNWALNSGSPSIDKGNIFYYIYDTLSMGYDLAGNYRIINNIIDLGAIEYDNGLTHLQNNLNNDFNFSLFPNPISDCFFIEGGECNTQYRINIFNSNGQLISNKLTRLPARIEINYNGSALFLLQIIDVNNTKMQTKVLIKK